jgi:hypothetical protein
MKKTSVAHNLLNKELLRAQNIISTDQIRWMVFKVKQRATSDYYDHIPDMANEAPQTRTNIGATIAGELPGALGIGGALGVDRIRTYPIQYNWPYDYISLVELARLDVEVLYRQPAGQKQKNRDLARKEISNSKISKTNQKNISANPGAKKKRKGGKY